MKYLVTILFSAICFKANCQNQSGTAHPLNEHLVKAGRSYNRALVFSGISLATGILTATTIGPDKDLKPQRIVGFGVSGAIMVLSVINLVEGNKQLILAGSNPNNGLSLGVSPLGGCLTYRF